MKHQLPTVNDTKMLKFPRYDHETGDLSIYESGAEVPMNIVRVFTVRGNKDARRGCHAHHECSQIIICANGACEISCDDGNGKKTFLLDSPDKGLLIPSAIWSDQTYLQADTILTVLCDQPYDEDDYIRDYDSFLDYRRGDVGGKTKQ